MQSTLRKHKKAMHGLPEEYAAILPSKRQTESRFKADYESFRALARNKQRMLCHLIHAKRARAPIEHGPAPPLKSLQRMSLQEVAARVNYLHADGVLFVRTSTEPYNFFATHTLVEYENIDCVPLCLYNYILDEEDASDFLPKDSYLAIRCPYMKNVKECRDQPLVLRCDNPECIIRFDSREEWLAAQIGTESITISQPAESATLLKEKGNDAFRNGKFETAWRLYRRAIKSESIEKDVLIACISNCAEVALRRGQWEQVKQITSRALQLEGANIKAKYRLATALLRLGEVSRATSLAEDLFDRDGKAANTEFAALRNDCYRVAEEMQGTYDTHRMRQDADRRKSSFHGDFVSPKIELGVGFHPEGKPQYRGVKAVSLLKRGTLVSASKAVVFVESEESSIDTFDSYQENLKVVAKLVVSMHRRPSLTPKVYKLSGGQDTAAAANGGNQLAEMSPEKHLRIDIARINSIIATNAFGASNSQHDIHKMWKAMKKGRRQENDDNCYGTGIWLNESLFNHSCVPNCDWNMIGDHIFVTTRRDIQPDEELCVSYVGSECLYEERCQKFRTWSWSMDNDVGGFKCRCPWCSVMEANSEFRNMTDRIEKVHIEAAPNPSVEDKVQVMNRTLPLEKRLEYLETFKSYPLGIQHNAGAHLQLMHGVYLKTIGDDVGALEHFEKAAEIKYAVCGTGALLDRGQDLWRVVGTAMCCKQNKKANAVLSEIWSNAPFDTLPKSYSVDAFVDFTVQYSVPYSLSWKGYCPSLKEYHEMEETVTAMARRVCQK